MASPVGRGFPPPALLPRGRLSAWLECVCAVTFDLELGQALEVGGGRGGEVRPVRSGGLTAALLPPQRIYPPEGSLTEKEVRGEGGVGSVRGSSLAPPFSRQPFSPPRRGRASATWPSRTPTPVRSLGDTQFSFRFRRSAGRRRAAEGERRCSREAPPGLQPEPAHLFGYVFFRQVRDRSVQRGYFQKSLVLVTRLPYVNLFHSLLHLIAPEYFEKLDPCLEAVCSEIDQWPPPVPGQTLNLPVMGVVIQVWMGGGASCQVPPSVASFCQEGSSLQGGRLTWCSALGGAGHAKRPDQALPRRSVKPWLLLLPNGCDGGVSCSSRHKVLPFPPCLSFFLAQNLLPAPLVLPSVAELDLFRCFQSVLVHVQLLWELILLGEPLVVVAPSPTMSSEVVLALASCLAPLKYCCDFRPYFTIHDSEFKEYTTRTQGPPSVLLGVTNPFFIKMLQHWPHILRLGELWMAGDLPKQVKLKKLAKLKTLDTKPGLYTSYRTFLHKDKTLIKRLLKGIQKKRPSEAQSALLRRQLLELTQSFIIPLEHYMASLMPLQRTITPWKTPPRIRPFHQEDFLKSLEHAGPQLTCVLKGDWLGLYRRFFKSPNFNGWFRQRHREMRHKLEALHLEAIAEANVRAWMVDKSEAEAVDLVLKLREKLVSELSPSLSPSPPLCLCRRAGWGVRGSLQQLSHSSPWANAAVAWGFPWRGEGRSGGGKSTGKHFRSTSSSERPFRGLLPWAAPARVAEEEEEEEEGAGSLVGSPVQVQARSRGLPAREETLQRVCQHITVVVRSLPEDLQAVLCHQEMAAAS
ncbi:hypothetical protein Chor_008091 [Crotalus horridus]